MVAMATGAGGDFFVDASSVPKSQKRDKPA